ncbi:MAG: hypothetical protein SF187_13175 [Deltaproteobacteria bacterium]|nr:hypothetical protein [Deltaproteobacteria bacterium]
MKPILLMLGCGVVAGCTFHAVATPSATGQPQPVVAQPAPPAAPYTPPPPPLVHRTPSEPAAPAPTVWRASPATAAAAPAPAPAPVVAAPAPAPYPDDRLDSRRDRKFDRHSDWDKLGERWVDGSVDRDVIAVGRDDGAYVALSMVAEHAPIEIFDMVVEFTDGTSFAPNLRYAFRPGATNYVIDLPGGARFVRRVTFRYGSLAANARAQLELWGLDARRDAGRGRDGHPGRGRHRGNNR